MANTHFRFQEDAGSDYNPSDSEDDYTEKEKSLLNKVRNRKEDDSDDEEVYGLESDDSDHDDDDSDIALSDVEGQGEENDLPNVRAWGKDKRKFYSTDFVDPDYGGFQGKNASLAELEEEEAKSLQKQLVQQLDDGDFSLDMFMKKNEPQTKDEVEEIIKSDVSTLSKRQKLQLLTQESPEFFELIEDFKAKMTLAKDVLKPILTLSKNQKIKPCEALDFVKFYNELILNYCTNISMYLLLKASKVTLKNHPIVKRLFQYRQHLAQVEVVFEEVVNPQLALWMSSEKNDSTMPTSPNKKKTLKLLSTLSNKKEKPTDMTKNNTLKKEDEKIASANDDEKINKKQLKFIDEKESDSESSDSSKIKYTEGMADEHNEDSTTITGEKRAITYQIAKNKGLTPHRKKEQRNPRVKHRNKFRKAKIRRKGAVREVRKEISRYAGEVSGIKASVTKSIKLKG